MHYKWPVFMITSQTTNKRLCEPIGEEMSAKKESRYQEVAFLLEDMIQKGSLKPGEKLPSENELSITHGLSRQTIRMAIAILQEKGLVDRVRGSGTYVSIPNRNPMEGRKTIALIMTYVDGYIFPRIIHDVQNVLYEKGYTVQILFTNNRIDHERVILEELLDRNKVAGIIAEATKSGIPNPDVDIYRKIMALKIPVLFINSYFKELQAPHVSMDDARAGRKATELLLQNGHRKIAGMFKLDDGQGHLRFSGFTEAMKAYNVSWSDENIIWYDTEDLKQLPQLMSKVLDRIKDCTGFVTYNDELAYSLVPLLKANGIRIPQDLSLASIDNSDLVIVGGTKISSVPYPLDRLGRKAAENMIRMIEEPGYDGNYEFDDPIKVRDSVIPVTVFED